MPKVKTHIIKKIHTCMVYTTGFAGPTHTLLGTSSCCYLMDVSKPVNIYVMAVGRVSCLRGLIKPEALASVNNKITK